MAVFSALTTTKLGKVGETYIAEFAKSKKSKAYIPAKDESYPVDSICISGNTIWFLEVKTKPRRKWYEDTGCDLNDFKLYCTLDGPVYILWADFITESLYGAWLDDLKPVLKEEKGKYAYFPLSSMTTYRTLTTPEVEELKKLNRSKYY